MNQFNLAIILIELKNEKLSVFRRKNLDKAIDFLNLIDEN